MANNVIDAYPLQWPLGEPRTPIAHRKFARFHSKGNSATPLSIAAALNRLKDELRKWDASDIVVSSNIPVRRDGLPYSRVAEPVDSGIAVYFRHKGVGLAFPCDRWNRVGSNIAAIAAHLQAMRSQVRWGVGRYEQAYAGYRALTAAEAVKSWWTVLGFATPPVDWAIVVAKHIDLVRLHHPDRGGDQAMMAAINAARDEARDFYADCAGT